ncbi:MAG: hypothetical protein FJ197_11900 [Gammaproteobacteria bacterium]|nr:hypothetical protein [Gammaproteobacteria bacterium]
MPPEGWEKIADPASIRHPLARRVIGWSRRLGVSAHLLLRVAVAQRAVHEGLARPRAQQQTA